MKKNHAAAMRTDPEIEISSDEALPVGAEASGPSLVGPSSGDDDGDMSGVGDGGDDADGESDELVGPSDELVGPSDELLGPSDELVGPSDELLGPPELESGLGAGVLAEEDFGALAGAPPPEDGEALGVAEEFFLVVVGAEAVGGEVGAEAVDFGDPAAVGFGDPAAAGCLGDAAAAGEGVGELLLALALGAPAGVGGSAAKTAVMAKTATARDRSVMVLVIFICECVIFLNALKREHVVMVISTFKRQLSEHVSCVQLQCLPKAMPKRGAEAPPSSETQRVKPADSFGDYRSQVSQLLSQEEKISLRDREATMSHSNTAIGAGMSHLKREDLNVLLRQCVRDLTPEVNEMHLRACSMKRFSDKAAKCDVPADSEDDVTNLLSNPDIVKKLTSQYSNVLLHELDDMQQQLENILDDVVATCRPMSRGEKLDLRKAIMELPGGNRDRIAGIVEEHCRTSGKEFSDEVIANLDQSEDNTMLWRLHFYVGAVKNAQKLAR
ncbi:hypothetical protein IGI04_008116 [Brassica rapa subsp. trilocularis]|uniref:NET domain-containing protein n=1 Tax=Brassica rapa subsp. trilocularis TaxID=1813537 RepID=A0ABQ7NLQ3_BRACM|nr:hypothetical protein IGI04_008116 [Brassica rapa subsp. trilocularis]